MFAKGLGLLISIIGVLWLGIAGAFGMWKYERLEPGWPNYKIGFLFVHVTLHAPGAGSVTALQSRLASLEAQERAAAAHAAVVARAQQAITGDANARAVVVQTRIRTVTRTLIQQVDHVVTPAVDSRYPLPVGVVRLYNASVLGVDLSAAPDPAGRADEAASDIAASSAAGVFVRNNGAANSCRAQLTGLQDWLTRVEAPQ